MSTDSERLEVAIRRLGMMTELAASLASEEDIDRLFERIVETGMALTSSDGGTVYVVDPENRLLSMRCVRNESLDIALGGTTGNSANYPAIRLFDAKGAPVVETVVSSAVHEGKTVVVEDAYTLPTSMGTRMFDLEMGYRTRSLLTVPLKDQYGNVVAALQLVNATDEQGLVGVPYTVEAVRFAEALASMGAVAISNRNLMTTLTQGIRAVTELSVELARDIRESLG